MTSQAQKHSKTDAVVYVPATVAAQRGGLLYDRTVVRLATSKYIPHRLVEAGILLAEVYCLNFPEWILGAKNGNAPPVEKRIESSIAASRLAIADAVSKGERRKVAVITGRVGKLKLTVDMAHHPNPLT